MRKLMWFTIGFAAACAGGTYWILPKALLIPGALLSITMLYFARNQLWIQKSALLLLGVSMGILWFLKFQSKILDPVYELDGVTREAQIRCTDFGEDTNYGIRVEGRMAIGEKSYSVLLYLNEKIDVHPGVVLTGSYRFQTTAPGGQKESTYFQGEGIYLLAYQKEELTISEEPQNWRDVPVKLRNKIELLLESLLPADTSPFAKALLLGRSSELSYGTSTDFTVSGIRHIVAVSGLHVSVLFGMLNFLSFRKRFLAAMISVPVLALFAAMTGFTPSVCRACIMSMLILLASLTNREYDGPSALAASGLILLLINPLVIASVGYQLSYSSVAGIFLFTPAIRGWIQSAVNNRNGKSFSGKCLNWLSLSVSVTLGATAATLPFCMIYFGVVSLASVLTNLLVLWAVSLIFYGLMGICLLSTVWISGAVFLGKLVSVLIRYVLLLARIIGDFPLSAVYTYSPYITFWLVFVFVLLGVFLLSREKRAETFVCCIILGLCTSLLASWTESLTENVRFTVLDVGQGQSLLLQTQGCSFLVDCGGSGDSQAADSAAEALLSQGISRLDGMILTHYDNDHVGGAENLLSRIGTSILVVPPVPSELSLEAEHILYATEDILFSVGNTEIHIFAPESREDSNENSLCVLFDTEDCDILITGDRNSSGEKRLLQTRDIPDVDVLVAGHHGSRDSVCEELLSAVRPEIVCISVGAGNPYGHPAPEVLQRLEQFGCDVYRTDLYGDITIRR